MLTASLAGVLLHARSSYGDETHFRTSLAEFLLLPNEMEKSEAVRQRNSSTSLKIPRGTILPIQSATSISLTKTKPGTEIVAKIMQDVPLPVGQKIPKGSEVHGKVTAISPAGPGAQPEISFRFDRLLVKREETTLTTNLRAIAGYVEVEQAQIPVQSSGEGEVYDWLPTKQIGGDDVFGQGGGTVTAWNNPSEVVGRSTYDGVLGKIRSRDGTVCRGELYGNDMPQALWLFSSDACGVYGLPHVTIAHAGRNEPLGLIVLRSGDRRLNLSSGTGMLLRVDKIGN